MAESNKPVTKNDAKKSSELPSSQGDSPVKTSPKDGASEDASKQDRSVKKTGANSDEDRTEELLDEASELSFPASDPIAVSSTTKLVKDKDGKLHPAPEASKKE